MNTRNVKSEDCTVPRAVFEPLTLHLVTSEDQKTLKGMGKNPREGIEIERDRDRKRQRERKKERERERERERETETETERDRERDRETPIQSARSRLR